MLSFAEPQRFGKLSCLTVLQRRHGCTLITDSQKCDQDQGRDWPCGNAAFTARSPWPILTATRTARTGGGPSKANSRGEGGAGGNSLEQRMHGRRFAAAWTADDHPLGTFNYPDHMRRVRRGDLIFMYANGLGVIGIGRATESRLELLFPDHPDRLRAFATEGENAEEWRIPVEWLVWAEDNPCEVEPLRSSFQEITDHVDRIRAVSQHFGL